MAAGRDYDGSGGEEAGRGRGGAGRAGGQQLLSGGGCRAGVRACLSVQTAYLCAATPIKASHCNAAMRWHATRPPQHSAEWCLAIEQLDGLAPTKVDRAAAAGPMPALHLLVEAGLTPQVRGAAAVLVVCHRVAVALATWQPRTFPFQPHPHPVCCAVAVTAASTVAGALITATGARLAPQSRTIIGPWSARRCRLPPRLLHRRCWHSPRSSLRLPSSR